MKHLWFDQALVAPTPDGIRHGVMVRVDGDGTTASFAVDVPEPIGDETVQRYRGLALPGAQNAHSHAFHRLLRGRTNGDGGTFWTWRQVMYRAAAQLTPENYFELARAVFAEMVTAGYTAVGEFHYVHHRTPDGSATDGEAVAGGAQDVSAETPTGGAPYPNHDMELALARAAAAAGIRLTLLDTCYLAGGINPGGTYAQLGAEQQRFSDGTIAAFVHRHTRLAAALEHEAQADPAIAELVTLGTAIHSVRAVPRPALPAFRDVPGPLHVHLSEQPAENDACRAAYGMSPTELLADAGLLSPRLSAVHATHLSARDISLLGAAGAHIVMCPTTEADLADGIGPARALADAGAQVALGSDQHVVLDPLLEARGLEAGERLASGVRGRFTPEELIAALTAGGSGSLRGPTGSLCGAAGSLRCAEQQESARATLPGFTEGTPADFLVLDTGSPRTIGALDAQAVLAATSADVTDVLVGGRQCAHRGEHAALGQVAELYREVFAAFDL